MANTSAINSLDELIIKGISAIRESQKRQDENFIYDSITIFLENYDIDDNLFWERMKYLEQNEVICNKPTKNGNSFYTSKRDWETVSSPIDQTPVMKSPNNYVSTPQDLEDNLSILYLPNDIETLDKFDTTLFNLTQILTKKKKSDKQR